MAQSTFNTPADQTIAREQLVCYLNTATYASPSWSALGKRVEDSSMDFDWGDETKQDVLGNVHSTMKKPVITQSFDPCNLDSADSAICKVWDIGVREKNPQALCSMDLLVVHLYAGESDAAFAERYPASMVKPTGLGGAGGGSIEMPIDITYGGQCETGTASVSGGKVTFTPGGAASAASK
ncbi:hypothetical protein [Adlercreutzia muris]|uniref:hypothetical protein n=1 Tax=Adlercreutzia muris TaxID=1796610 RepID=UPI0013664CA6|nr:hypothetical protein [Adlercreutzia muris]NCA32122.1 hypothetical protein [Adlercreutzia muris]